MALSLARRHCSPVDIHETSHTPSLVETPPGESVGLLPILRLGSGSSVSASTASVKAPAVARPEEQAVHPVTYNLANSGAIPCDHEFAHRRRLDLRKCEVIAGNTPGLAADWR